MSSILANTDRLLIRPLRERDAEAIAELWSNPEAMHFMVGPRDPKAIRSAFLQLARAGPAAEERWWILIDPNSGEFIGQCGLCPKELEGRQETELVYLIVPSRWGQGFASEAAVAVVRHARDVSGLKRLIALIELGNSASEVVAGRAGLTYEHDILRPGGRVMKLFLLDLLG